MGAILLLAIVLLHRDMLPQQF
ncbi:hypothetical protein AB0756_09435 [Tolypothrix campylonemoides VB511288_2]|uniref:Uncharacterized protein n=2 Tax=Nostocales TaxID=1161 RepID=A0ABW8WMX2_9CYAN